MGYTEKEMGLMKKIYILHGWSYNTVRWAKFVNILTKKGWKVTMLKVPGLTESIKEPWTLDNYVEWLEKILPKSPVHLLGHSNGGRIGLQFALKYPSRLKHLVLIDSAGIYRKDLALQIKRFIFTGAAKIGRRITKSPALRKLLYKLARETDYEKADEHLKKTMLNLIAVDLKPNLHKIKVPTTIIWGENDRITLPKEGKIMHEEIKGSTLHVVSGARHSPQFTHPKEVADIVLSELEI